MKFYFLLILSLLNGIAYAQPQKKCFQNDALQGKQLINFEQRGTSVTGTFEFENGESELAKRYKFSGIFAGNVLRVKFENGELPDVLPSEMKSLSWALLKTGEAEILRIKFYGKNYETNQYADYFADFRSCEPNYDALLKAAKVVQFSKGKTYAGVPLAFRNLDERKSFSINARRGQRLEIEASGCKISVYLPGGGLYEFVEWEIGGEKTFTTSAIDRTAIETLPQTGNYLIVLQKMAEAARPVSATFEITK